MIPTPTHGTLPSGHSTEAFIVARTLWKLLRLSNAPQYTGGAEPAAFGDMLMRQAARIAINRTVAGVHFPVDSAAGAVLGLTLADYVANRCTFETGQSCANTLTNTSFVGKNFNAGDDFNWHLMYDPADDETTAKLPITGPEWMETTTRDASTAQTDSPALQWLWTKAAKEWNDVEE